MNAILKPAYRLRPMQVDDLDAVMRIEPTIYSHPWSRGNFADSLNSGYSAWVLTMGDEIIGYSLMMLVLDEAHLLNISVAKAYQKQGYGRVLLEHMIDRARHYKALNMFLEVRASNIAAISLYENIGFNEMSIRRNYYPAANGREDAILMGLAL
jgi:[ribosomal protein S18]-alanine N-acetyltransferase